MADTDKSNTEDIDNDEYKLLLSDIFPSTHSKRIAEVALKQRNSKRKKVNDQTFNESLSNSKPQEVKLTAVYNDDVVEDEDEDEYVPKVTTRKQQSKKSPTPETLFKNMMTNVDSTNHIKYFKTLSKDEQCDIISKMTIIREHSNSKRPYLFDMLENKHIPLEYKSIVYNKIISLQAMDPGNSEYSKTKCWIDNFTRIPFGVYKDLTMTIDDGPDKCNEYMSNASNILDEVVYGMEDAKYQFMQMLGKWVTNPDAKANAIAIKGPMGTGKTTLIKDGISRILGREFALIALGGANDGSYLDGHSYTYEGSIYGKIVDILIQTKTMNPIIFMDELDKVSSSPKGDEIIGILTHLTDSSQNTRFNDKYFSELELDLSRCLFIFSYNDESLVNPILLDRMYKVETKGYTPSEKQIISQQYLIPGVMKEYKIPTNEITITPEAIMAIINEYTNDEKGVRNLKRCIETIYAELNLYKIMGSVNKFKKIKEEVVFPYTLKRENVSMFVKLNTTKNTSHAHMYV